MKINTPVKIENSNGMYNAIIESSGEFIGWHGLCAECELNNVEKCNG